tara:strand:- start:16241 stop:18193 length:1953 start_codon:yes stop_codon:yes gene_type:complete
MALINLQTDLTSLKYGHDRPGGGSSNQPYIQTDIPDGDLPAKSPDFLLRNGFLAPVAAAKDTSRITQMFFDTKSPNGLLFTAKENLLSRISVKTQATKGPAYAGGTINQGVYLPTSTIAQTLVGFTGTHLNLLGLDPSSPMSGVVEGDGLLDALGLPGLGLNRYEDKVNRRLNKDLPNRLIGLTEDKINKESTNPKGNILSYDGGPGSIGGIGETRIKFADQRTGINNTHGKDFAKYQVGYDNRGWSSQTLPNYYSPIDNTGTFGKEVGVSFVYSQRVPEDFNELYFDVSNGANGGFSRNFKTSVYDPFPSVTIRANDNNTLTWGEKQLSEVIKNNFSSFFADPTLDDFREPLLEDEKLKPRPSSTIMSLAPDYKNKLKTIEGNSDSRIHYVSPGQKGNIINYTEGKRDGSGNNIGPVDRINALPVYSSKAVKSEVGNDLIKFRIAAINNTNPLLKDYIHFRAYIDSFSDNYSGNWDSVNYMGRGESFYKYGSFKRSISLGFTVAAQSKQELIPMYKKLNFLASNLAPTYSSAGYMAGSLVTLTLGGWCYELPGFITGMTLDVPQESPWEIGINTDGTPDSTVKELPMIVKVSGFSFTPIEEFRPAKQTITPGKKGGILEDTNKYSDERYIALEAGNNNYTSKGEFYPQT